MPTYEYRCDACGHELEQFQSIKDAPLKKCPKCGKAKLKRLISAGGGVIFKGAGFWQTDYRSDSYKEAARKDAPPSESKSESKTETKSETKTEAKPAAKPEKAEKPAKPDKKKK
jgi:putative FmdB family regulatory protein